MTGRAEHDRSTLAMMLGAGAVALAFADPWLLRHAAPALVRVPRLAVALHAAGPERIRALVRPSAGLSGALPAVAITAYVVALAVVSATVHLPYASAALTACS